jgi:hypothetical protein
MQAEKPIVFISHASTDASIVDILRSEIDRVFAYGVKVFASSVPGVIKPGDDWLVELRSNLENAKAVIVLITPVSINRPWVWFEVGAYWSKLSAGSGRVYPLCVPEVDLSDLPEPLNRLEALSLGKTAHVKLLFQTLCGQFGFGNMKSFKTRSITSRLPKYSDIKVVQSDLQTGTIYDGPYKGYSDEELQEVLDEYLYKLEAFQPNQMDKALKLAVGGRNIDRNNIFEKALIHYQQFDTQLHLPPGTSKRLLKTVALRYGLVPTQDWEHSVRFGRAETKR